MVWVAGPGRPKGVFLRPLGVFPSPLVDPVHPQKAPFSLPDCLGCWWVVGELVMGAVCLLSAYAGSCLLTLRL